MSADREDRVAALLDDAGSWLITLLLVAIAVGCGIALAAGLIP